jgi:long-subunit acyl-CoA synthetase (AMP-forming)
LPARLAAGAAADPAVLYLTSGATGEPKMVLVTHGALVSNADMAPHVFRRPQDQPSPFCRLPILRSAW